MSNERGKPFYSPTLNTGADNKALRLRFCPCPCTGRAKPEGAQVGVTYANLTIKNCNCKTVGFEKATEAPPFLVLVYTLVTPQNLLRAALCLLPQNYKEERFSNILKMDYGGKCSVPVCTGNADTFHNLPKELDTLRVWLMFFNEKIPVKFIY